MRGIRGIRVSPGDNDISVRVQGTHQDTVAAIGDTIVQRLASTEGALMTTLTTVIDMLPLTLGFGKSI